MSVNVDMKEQFVNDTCMLFQRLQEDADISRIRSILVMATNGWQMQKATTDVALYKGSNNDQLIRNFLVTKKVNGCTDRTIKFYGYTLKMFFDKVQKEASDVTANDIRVYFAERELKDKVGHNTRDNERRNLSSFYTWLVDEEYITRSPMRKIPKIKGKKEKKKAFSEMEIEKIREAASKTNAKWIAIIEILLSTACRVSELCNIRVDEINGDKVTVHGKGQKDRICYLTARAQLAIKAYMETEWFKKRNSLGNEYLFPREHTIGPERYMPMNLGTAECAVRHIGKEAGVQNVHPHRFRRTCATNALKRGMPIEQVSKMLGHESLETTQIYLDLDEESLSIAHKKYVS